MRITTMKIIDYLLPYLAIIYGVLIIKGFIVPRRMGTDSGEFFIILGLFAIVLIHVLAYYKIKTDKHTNVPRI